ncbi:helix-turn-helix transcriptional regulator [Enterococcus faecium]|nr:helix-turn-helix transcriptional regulator [Enterococcus faecium]
MSEFERLKGWRAERKITQKDMAEALGMGLATYRRKENGQRPFKLEDVVKAKTILELDPQYYFFYKFSNQSVTEGDATNVRNKQPAWEA